MPFDKDDTLRQAGYSEGDILPVASFPPQSARASGISSSSYTAAVRFQRIVVAWDDIIPDGSQGLVAAQHEGGPGTGETLSQRWQNVTDNETVLEISPVGARSWSGWSDYTPATTGSKIQIQFQHKTEPGSNSSTSRDPMFWFGVQL